MDVRHLLSSVVAVAALLTTAGAAPAFADSESSALEAGTYVSDTSMVALAVQVAAEAEVADFAAANPVPEYALGSSMEEFERFNVELLAYYERVPWEATVEQWGCVVTVPAVWSERTTSTGEPTVVVEGGYRCADQEIAPQFAGTTTPKTDVLTALGLAAASAPDPTSVPEILGCGAGNEVSMCITQPATGTVRASATLPGAAMQRLTSVSDNPPR